MNSRQDLARARPALAWETASFLDLVPLTTTKPHATHYPHIRRRTCPFDRQHDEEAQEISRSEPEAREAMVLLLRARL